LAGWPPAKRAGAGTALVPGRDDLGGRELLRRVHAHVEWRVVGVGEAALARVELHRGHAEVEEDEIGADPLRDEALQRFRERRAHEASPARELRGELGEARRGAWVAVDRDEQSVGAQAVGDQARVAAAPERTVDRGFARARVEQLDELAGQHRDVDEGHVNQDGQVPR
jgi:hypothetical protein